MVSKAFDVSKFGSSIFTSFIGVLLSLLGGLIATDLVVCLSNLETVFHVLHGVFKGIGVTNIFWKKADHGIFIVGPIVPSPLGFLAIMTEGVEGFLGPPFLSSNGLDVVHQLVLGLRTLLVGQYSRVGVVREPGELEGLFSPLWSSRGGTEGDARVKQCLKVWVLKSFKKGT